jgi:hypothetical protein
MRDLLFTKLDINSELAVTTVPQTAELTEGRQYLLQLIIKRLLTLKGSYSEDLNFGTEFVKYAYGKYATDISKFSVVLPLIINDLTAQIQTLQEEQDIPSNQRLLKIDVISTEYDSTFGGWYTILDVYTADTVGTLIRIV